MFKNSLKMAALAAGVVAPSLAMAAASAVVTTDLNIRTGPSAAYQRFDTIPAGDDVTVFGCLTGYNWCDIGWNGDRGWVSGDYLAYLGERYYRRPISTIGITIGLPVLGFDPYDYHSRYYTDRDWYDGDYLGRREVRRERREDRQEFREERRDDRREVRRDRREERRDARRDDRRDDRREVRQERRQDRQEIRREVRPDREVREERREDRQEVRQERRQDRQDARQQEARPDREARQERRAQRRNNREERRDERQEGSAEEIRGEFFRKRVDQLGAR